MNATAAASPQMSPAIGLSETHQLFEGVLDDVIALVKRGSFVTAAKRFGELRRSLQVHASVEEEVWFSRLPPRELERGDVAQIRTDHLNLRQLMEKACGAFTHFEDTVAFEALRELRLLLAAHHRREDALPYPAIAAK